MPTLSESITTRKFNQFLRKYTVKHLSESYELTITYGSWKFYRPTDTLNYGKIISKSTKWFTTNTQKSKCKSTKLIPYNWHLTAGVFYENKLTVVLKISRVILLRWEHSIVWSRYNLQGSSNYIFLFVILNRKHGSSRNAQNNA